MTPLSVRRWNHYYWKGRRKGLWSSSENEAKNGEAADILTPNPGRRKLESGGLDERSAPREAA
jgi:hypothetical protein